jgi:hypothetical protein
MALRLVGAGVGRTGTHSLKLALERLLAGPCYHMLEVFGHPEHVPMWQAAANGDMPDWNDMLRDYVAIVDWPGASFWRELSEANPEAVILLSVRADADAWYRSADKTIFEITRRPPPPESAEWFAMWTDIARNRFTNQLEDRDAAVAAYERHNDDVRANAPADRLVEWKPGDGWEPLCAALGVDVPDEPFPHVNTTDEFRAMVGLDAPPT